MLPAAARLQVPQSVVDAKGLSASEWMLAVVQAGGGRGGGKATSAQGQVADSALQIDAAVNLADQFARSRLGA